MKNTFHSIIDISRVDFDTCMDDIFILNVLVESANIINANIIATNRYRFGHNSPNGCTAFVLIDESHLSAHTYADNGKIAIDVFTCNGYKECVTATEHITSFFPSAIYTKQMINRFK